MPRRPDPYLTDEDNPELAPEQMRAMRPAAEVLQPALYESLVRSPDGRIAIMRVETMETLGLDDRSRNADGRIRQKRGDTLNKNLPRSIPGFSANTTLEKMREVTEQVSESGVRRAAVEKK